MTALPQWLRAIIRDQESQRMQNVHEHAEPRMAPAKAANADARILRAPQLDNPASAGSEGAMTL